MNKRIKPIKPVKVGVINTAKPGKEKPSEKKSDQLDIDDRAPEAASKSEVTPEPQESTNDFREHTAPSPAPEPTASVSEIVEENLPEEEAPISISEEPVIEYIAPPTASVTPAETEKPLETKSQVATVNQSSKIASENPALKKQGSVDDRLKDVRPNSPHSDEMKLERFIQLRNNKMVITHNDLGQSGINMSSLGMLEGRFGKFKLRRDYALGDWKVTITEVK